MKFKYSRLAKGLLSAMPLLLAAGNAFSQQVVTLRVHHFLPQSATGHAKVIEPWCAKIAAESENKLKCQIYTSMQLGGTPAQLFDQAKDGVVDIVWAIPSYQAGRFMVSEVFELPFFVTSVEKGSEALWHYATKHAVKEFAGVKPILFHLHDGNVLHSTKKHVKTLEDFKGLKIRSATRQSTKMITALGGAAVPMPLPQTPEALAKGVIDGALVPWEVVPSIKLEEIIRYHTELDQGLGQFSNSVFIFGMNLAKYESLPPDLKKVIDANSGPATSAWAGKVFAEAGVPGRRSAEALKNRFYSVPANEVTRWKKAAESVTQYWMKDVKSKGYDGEKLLKEAKSFMSD